MSDTPTVCAEVGKSQISTLVFRQTCPKSVNLNFSKNHSDLSWSNKSTRFGYQTFFLRKTGLLHYYGGLLPSLGISEGVPFIVEG